MSEANKASNRLTLEMTGSVYVISYEGGKKQKIKLDPGLVLKLLEKNIHEALALYLQEEE